MATPLPTPSAVPSAAPTGGSATNQLLNEAGQTGDSTNATANTDPNAMLVPTLTGLGREGWGTHSNSLLDAGRSGPATTTGTDSFQTDRTVKRQLADVTLDAMRMSDSELDALGKRLQDAGLIPKGAVPSRGDLESAWGDLVKQAAVYHQANPASNLTPEDMIDLYGGQRLIDSKKTAPTLESAEGARTMLTNMMSTSLGRDPTTKEADDFQAALNAALANPSLAPTASTVDPTTGNMTLNESDFANKYNREHIQNSDEYGHYQAATTYYNALLDAIKSPVPLTTLGNR